MQHLPFPRFDFHNLQLFFSLCAHHSTMAVTRLSRVTPYQALHHTKWYFKHRRQRRVRCSWLRIWQTLLYRGFAERSASDQALFCLFSRLFVQLRALKLWSQRWRCFCCYCGHIVEKEHWFSLAGCNARSVKQKHNHRAKELSGREGSAQQQPQRVWFRAACCVRTRVTSDLEGQIPTVAHSGIQAFARSDATIPKSCADPLSPSRPT